MRSRKRYRLLKTSALNQEEIDYLKSLSYQDKIKQLEYDLPLHEGDTSHQDTIRVLSEDPDYRIRSYIAGMSQTPVEVLRKLAEEDTDYSVLIPLIYNMNTTPDIIDTIVSYGDPDLNASAVKSPSISAATLESILTTDGNTLSSDDAQYLAESRQDLTETVIRLLYKWYGIYQRVTKELVTLPNTPKDILLDIVNKDPYSARYIAFRDSLDNEVVEALVGNGELHLNDVVSPLLENNNLSPSIIDRLYKQFPNYSRAVAKHPNTTHRTLLELTSEEDYPTLIEILKRQDIPSSIKDSAAETLKNLESKELSKTKLRVKERLRSTEGLTDSVFNALDTDKAIKAKSNSDLEILLRLKSHLEKS